MKLLKLTLGILFLVSLSACNKESETTVVTKYVGCSKALEAQGDCIRWMDRNIYMAYSNGTDRNNEFQKAKVKEALVEIQQNTILGENYFTFTEVDEGLLSPIIEPGLSPSSYKSFILIWPDAQFNAFVVNTLGGNVPDANAITVINSAYKRKFYMIFKASCFSTSPACNNLSTPGLRALVARQLGFLTGLPPVNCAADPENVMCASAPSDLQWGELNKQRWQSTENNILEVILNNPNYYDEYIPPDN
jgi:hypothetical protein